MSIIFYILSGALVGILINYFSDVLPATRKIARPSCENCGAEFSVSDYLFLKACTNCGSKRKYRSVIVLMLSVIACVLLKFFPFPDLNFFASIPILSFMGVIMVIDIEHRLVLIQTSFSGLVLFFLYGVIMNGIISSIYGGLIGFAIMMFFYFAGKMLLFIAGRLRGINTDEVAFGLGDVFFGTIIGFLTGSPAVIGSNVITMLAMVLFSSFLFIYLILKGKYRAYAVTLPFTTFQVLGAIAALFLDLTAWLL